MARVSDPVDRFARFLAQSEHSPPTIKNYRSDFDAFTAWFRGANGEPMEPAKVTPTDLRQFKRWLVERRRLKPNTVNRELATLNSFLIFGNRSKLPIGYRLSRWTTRDGPAPPPRRASRPG
jgi:site-specific recombinase XerD